MELRSMTAKQALEGSCPFLLSGRLKWDTHIGADSTCVHSTQTARLGPAAIPLCILSCRGKQDKISICVSVVTCNTVGVIGNWRS